MDKDLINATGYTLIGVALIIYAYYKAYILFGDVALFCVALGNFGVWLMRRANKIIIKLLKNWK